MATPINLQDPKPRPKLSSAPRPEPAPAGLWAPVTVGDRDDDGFIIEEEDREYGPPVDKKS